MSLARNGMHQCKTGLIISYWQGKPSPRNLASRPFVVAADMPAADD